MKKVALILGGSLLSCIIVIGSYSFPANALSRASIFETADPSLVVKIKRDKKDDNDDDDDDDDKPKSNKKAFTCKKAKCDPGETKLDKPNIYGACCQATAAPLTPKTTPVEPEKCKFPGEVGTPPNCTCPPGTEFLGYKGCVKKVAQRICCKGKFPNGASAGKACGDEEAGLRRIMASSRIIGDPTPPSSITCAPEK